ncbi:unnamed protein product [Macrosiphum euphorbiae]|uniref:C2H2-type domain-containing protein n=1 Tax=Macrosiphum euphorbiae TaxID=13131 RepID=A0AAV0XWE9_9HEMI|nr:unnamed protein product [Macrosiphum euphorbiae]
MGVCFVCDTKLYGERTRVCSSITKHGQLSYPEKIAELLGDDVVVIVTPADHMCKKCNSCLTFMDKAENDLKLVKRAILSFIKKKYGILPPDHVVEDINVVNGHLVVEDQVEQGQCNVSSGLKIVASPTVTTAAPVMPVQTPSKLLKTQQQPQQHQQQQQQPPTQQESKIKIYKCACCAFQSKELGHVRFHMRTHVKKKEPEKPILKQATARYLTPESEPKKRIYRCQLCSKSFDGRMECIDHIKQNHNQSAPSTSNAEKGIEDSRPVISILKKPKPPKTQENNQQAESSVDKNLQDDNKDTIDTDKMLNDCVLTEGSVDVEQKEKTKNSQEDMTLKEEKSEIKPDLTHEKAIEEEEEDTAMLGQEEEDQETPDSVKIEYVEENENVKTKTQDSDIDTILAEIYNDNPNNNEDTQNKD